MITSLNEAKHDVELIVTESCPVRFLREVKDDGTEQFIGDIGFFRYNRGELMGAEGTIDWSIKAEWEEKNRSLPLGDPSIIWALGGKGI